MWYFSSTDEHGSRERVATREERQSLGAMLFLALNYISQDEKFGEIEGYATIIPIEEYSSFARYPDYDISPHFESAGIPVWDVSDNNERIAAWVQALSFIVLEEVPYECSTLIEACLFGAFTCAWGTICNEIIEGFPATEIRTAVRNILPSLDIDDGDYDEEYATDITKTRCPVDARDEDTGRWFNVLRDKIFCKFLEDEDYLIELPMDDGEYSQESLQIAETLTLVLENSAEKIAALNRNRSRNLAILANATITMLLTPEKEITLEMIREWYLNDQRDYTSIHSAMIIAIDRIDKPTPVNLEGLKMLRIFYSDFVSD